ncbi:MAG TPA: alpha/beta hydrolase [Lacunisphaera sp.]|nr:alpha/beta hydrolase [Lacunisphaera sp.]
MSAGLTDEQKAMVRQQLARLQASPVFALSSRLHRFLAYITQAELEGKGAELNQARIALEVFGRDASFDPAIDSVVRVEAGRLRVKLKEYFAAEGAADPVVIDLPKGRYQPRLVFRPASPPRRARGFAQHIRFCRTPDGASIAYAESGQGAPLVKAANWLSHLEFDGESLVWRHWWRDLSDRYRLIRYDERGCGLSDWNATDFSLEAWTRDLEQVVDAVGVERFPLLGISQGAAVAINYAVRHPERVSHLILYGGYVQGRLKRNPSPQQRDEAELLQDLARIGWGGTNAAFSRTFANIFVPGADEAHIQAFDELQRASTSAKNAVRFLDAFGHLDVTELAPRVRMQTLVLHARDEIAVPVSQAYLMARLIPHARLVTLESRNHVIGESEPAWPQFLGEVDRFLRDG